MIVLTIALYTLIKRYPFILVLLFSYSSIETYSTEIEKEELELVKVVTTNSNTIFEYLPFHLTHTKNTFYTDVINKAYFNALETPFLKQKLYVKFCCWLIGMR